MLEYRFFCVLCFASALRPSLRAGSLNKHTPHAALEPLLLPLLHVPFLLPRDCLPIP